MYLNQNTWTAGAQLTIIAIEHSIDLHLVSADSLHLKTRVLYLQSYVHIIAMDQSPEVPTLDIRL